MKHVNMFLCHDSHVCQPPRKRQHHLQHEPHKQNNIICLPLAADKNQELQLLVAHHAWVGACKGRQKFSKVETASCAVLQLNSTLSRATHEAMQGQVGWGLPSLNNGGCCLFWGVCFGDFPIGWVILDCFDILGIRVALGIW